MASFRAHFRHQLHLFRSSLLRTLGYRVLWVSRLFFVGPRQPVPSFGVNGLDSRLREYIDLEPQYYIEIGANDGVSQSNTLALELCFGWRGILIEPSKAIFERLKKNRSARRNFLLQAACVSRDYPATTVELFYSNLMSVVSGLESDVPDARRHAEQGAKFLRSGDRVKTESAPATTLDSALEIAMAPEKIGLLSLDVEGAEIEVLKGLSLNRFRIEWILVECRDFPTMRAYLSEFGYLLEATLSQHDFLFRKVSG